MSRIFILAFSCFVMSPSFASSVVVTGSSTIAPLVAELAKTFEKKHHQVRVEVQTGGSSRGLTDALKGRADIGMVSRAIKPSDGNIQHFPIARDGVALIVHRSNPLATITKDLVYQIFTKKLQNWSALQGGEQKITVVHKASGRSTQEIFLSYLGVKNRAIKPDVIIGDNAHGIKTVSQLKGAIGYVSIGAALQAMKAGAPIKLLALDQMKPTIANLKKGLWPMSRELNLVTKAQPEGVVKDFIQFTQSKIAKPEIERQGFVAITM